MFAKKMAPSMITYNYINKRQSSCRSKMCDCKRDRLWVRFPLKEMKYLIFSIPRSSNEIKRDVEFHDSTHNASRIT